jgi:hypothetical protein
VNIDEFLDELYTEIKQEKAARKAQALMPRQGEWNYGAMNPDLYTLIHDGVSEGSLQRSDQFHHAVGWLYDLDWSINGIVWLLERHPQGIASKYEGRLRQEVERSFNKAKPHRKHGIKDFLAYGPQHTFLYLPKGGEPWPEVTVNRWVPPVAVVDHNGKLVVDKNGVPIFYAAAKWLDRNRPVDGMTWAPGLPRLVYDKVMMANRAWVDAPGKVTFNKYIPPDPDEGDWRKAKPWIKLAYRLWGQYARIVILWFAYRVQRPNVKINFGIMFAGDPNIGKDTFLAGVRMAIGEWNCREIPPKQVDDKFNAWAETVFLRISETRDIGEKRYDFYASMKTILASPPETLSVSDKYIRRYEILNAVGTGFTSNYGELGIYLPANDRRTLVLWSERKETDFREAAFRPRDHKPIALKPTHWDWMWEWYENGGFAHVAAFLRQEEYFTVQPQGTAAKNRRFLECGERQPVTGRN